MLESIDPDDIPGIAEELNLRTLEKIKLKSIIKLINTNA